MCKRKLTNTHSTLIPFVVPLRNWAEKEGSVNRIVAGKIRRTKSSSNTYKVKKLSGCILVLVKANVSIQEIMFYVSDAEAFLTNLNKFAKNNNIKVCHE